MPVTKKITSAASAVIPQAKIRTALSKWRRGLAGRKQLGKQLGIGRDALRAQFVKLAAKPWKTLRKERRAAKKARASK
jgi:hypothetical protein